MIQVAQVLKLRQRIGKALPLYRAAWKVGMDTKTAWKDRPADRLWGRVSEFDGGYSRPPGHPNSPFRPKTSLSCSDPYPDSRSHCRALAKMSRYTVLQVSNFDF